MKTMVEPLYRIHVVAERVGVTEALLRAWERRYGLMKPRRTPGGYRAYTEIDIAVLKRVKELTDQGVSIAEAATHAPQLRGELEKGVEARAAAEPAVDLDQLERWKAEILAAASAFDQGRVDAVLDDALGVLPPLKVFERLVVPVQTEVGDRWHQGELSVAEEHLVSQALRSRMVAVLVSRPRKGARHVVCACFPDEEHDIGLLGAALRFREAGWRVTYLGARTPAKQLGRAIAESRPNLLALSSLLDPGPRPFRTTLSRVMKELPKGTRVVVGGAAARKHAEIVSELGAQLLETPAQWDAVLT